MENSQLCLLLTAVLATQFNASFGTSCNSLEVELVSDNFRIPWSLREHYIKVGESLLSSLTCTLKESKRNDPTEDRNTSVLLRNGLVEWIFHPEYETLESLAKESLTMDLEKASACRFPVSNQVPSLPHDKNLTSCDGRQSNGLLLTIGPDRQVSKLRFAQASPQQTGSYQCRWYWPPGSGCQEPGHSPHRSAVIFVKVFQDRDYLLDLATAVFATLVLLLVMSVLVCLDHQASKKTHPRAFSL